jgi:histidinol dehydrogenase
MKLISRMQAGTLEAQTFFDGIGRRAEAEDAGIMALAADVLGDIRRRGWEAVREYSLRFDGAEPYEVSRDDINAAVARVEPALRSALERAARNIEDYHKRLVPKGSEWMNEDGGRVGQTVRGLERVGVYVPGGTAAYPSSVLANVVPAKAAGVKEVILTTPPTRHLKNSVLAAAYIAGADRVFAIGGVQAVAALAFGFGPFPKVDKIVGPGNAYVTAAKRLAYGIVDIDAIAGPSDICIIADGTANAEYIAADLLSQAEHDVLSQAVLLSTSERICAETGHFIETQMKTLSRRCIAEKSWNDYGMVVHCDSLDSCIELANEIAPEHLEILTAEPREILPKIDTAGAVFLGPYTPEPVGDYIAGPSHVLPTYGTARFFSPLSAAGFMKKISLIEYSENDLTKCRNDIITLAEEEGLDAHAYAVAVRQRKD